MTSVERVVEYTKLESEAPWETQKRPPPDWPSRGLVTFDKVNFSYSSDGPVVLKNISAMFRPREKVSPAPPLLSLMFRVCQDVCTDVFCSALIRLGSLDAPVQGKAP